MSEGSEMPQNVQPCETPTTEVQVSSNGSPVISAGSEIILVQVENSQPETSIFPELSNNIDSLPSNETEGANDMDVSMVNGPDDLIDNIIEVNLPSIAESKPPSPMITSDNNLVSVQDFVSTSATKEAENINKSDVLILQSTSDAPLNTSEPVDLFKLPKPPKGKKRILSTVTAESNPKKKSAIPKIVTETLDESILECVSIGRKKVNIYPNAQFSQWLKDVPNVSSMDASMDASTVNGPDDLIDNIIEVNLPNITESEPPSPMITSGNNLTNVQDVVSTSAIEEAENNNTSHVPMLQSISEPVNLFKSPKPLKGKKIISSTVTEESKLKKNTAGSKVVTETSDESVLECESSGRKKVNIYTNDQFPQWLKTHSDVPNVSRLDASMDASTVNGPDDLIDNIIEVNLPNITESEPPSPMITSGNNLTNVQDVVSTSAIEEAENNNTSHVPMLQRISEPVDLFKPPKPPKGKKIISSTVTESNLKKNTASSKVVTETSDESVLECESNGRKKVNIYTNDQFPQWFEIHSDVSNVSKTISPRKLPEAFSFLPIFGWPKSKADLHSFQENKIRDFVGNGLSDEEFAKLAQYASADHFLTGKEMEVELVMPNVGIINNMVMYKPNEEDTEAPPLCVVNKYKLRKENDKANIFNKRLKYRGMRMMPLPQEDETSPIGIETPLNPGKDVVFHIRVYRPFHYNTNKVKYRGRHSVFARDLVMVGSQRLTELRDSFLCVNDVDMRVDLSERIDEPSRTSAKELFPSGFLFINNIFYVDTRAGCWDISERIRTWAVNKRGLGRFPCKDMGSVTLADLNYRLGHPEVYVHQGNCEHLFTVSELRLLTAVDPPSLAQYPCTTAISQNQTVYCTTCAEFGAKFIVTGCNKVPFDPSFFCDTCLNLYLYKEGKKVCDFKAYSFRGNEMHSVKQQG